jgi:hypothetical protein
LGNALALRTPAKLTDAPAIQVVFEGRAVCGAVVSPPPHAISVRVSRNIQYCLIGIHYPFCSMFVQIISKIIEEQIKKNLVFKIISETRAQG